MMPVRGIAQVFRGEAVNHEEAYRLDDGCTNWVRSSLAGCAGEIGHHHHISGDYLLRYAQEASWREDNRRVPNGAQVERLTGLGLASGKSAEFTGYWQRHEAK